MNKLFIKAFCHFSFCKNDKKEEYDSFLNRFMVFTLVSLLSYMN